MGKHNPNQKVDGKTLLEIQEELEWKSLESGFWDDKTHLEEDYKLHEDKFFRVIRSMCWRLGMYEIGEIDEKGFYSLELQNGKQRGFYISKDFHNQKGEGKLCSHTEINDDTKARILLFYSPTKGINFSYSANLMEENIQLGKNDFFGKNIERIITNIGSATNGIKFDTSVERFDEIPNSLKNFYIYTEDFVPSEKQEDVISIISVLDGLVRGLYYIPQHRLYGENFKHQKSKPLFSITIGDEKISI